MFQQGWLRRRPRRRASQRSGAVRGLLIGTLIAVGWAAGCAVGEETNYRELERDPQPLQPERDPMFGTSPVRLAWAPVASGETGRAALAAAIAAHTVGEGRENHGTVNHGTLRGEDRLDWEPITFRPALGQIQHRPTYIAAPPVSDDVANVRGGPVESRIEAALAGATREPVTLRRVLAVPVDATWFYTQALLLPVKGIVYPPTSRELTPPGPAQRERADREPVEPVDAPDVQDAQHESSAPDAPASE